jgi:hypothetical protein
MNPDRVFVTGVPRSGTTWVGRALGYADHAAYVGEPDNPHLSLFAMRAKRGLDQMPIFEDGAVPASYARLWELAFSPSRIPSLIARSLWSTRIRSSTVLRGLRHRKAVCGAERSERVPLAWRMSALLDPPRRAGGRCDNVVVKSVMSAFIMDWIQSRWSPRVLILFRDPLNVIASAVELGILGEALESNPLVRERYLVPWGITPPSPMIDSRPHLRVSWNVGLLLSVQRSDLARHPDWIVAEHETLCADPIHGFRDLCSRLGLGWNDGIGEFLERSNRPGAGYQTNRIAGAQPERWRSLSPAALRDIRACLDEFPTLHSLPARRPAAAEGSHR